MRFLSKKAIMRPVVPIAYGVLSVVGHAAINRYIENPGWRWAGFGIAALLGFPLPIAIEAAKHFGLDSI